MNASEDPSIYDAVMAMKDAVDVAIQHGDIREEAVCKGVGMATAQLRSWLTSRVQSGWDTKVAEWLKRTQGKALQEQKKQHAALTAKSSFAPRPKASIASGLAVPTSSAGSSATTAEAQKASAADQRALAKLKDDLHELENYVPWNAVVMSWGGRRAQWSKRLNECPDVSSVAKQLVALEAALLDAAVSDDWRSDGSRDEWVEEVLEERSPNKLRALLREMEENIRWQAFATLATLQDALKDLLVSPGGALLKEAAVATADPDGSGSALTVKTIHVKLEQFKISTMGQLATVCKVLAEATADASACAQAIDEILVSEEPEPEPEPEEQQPAKVPRKKKRAAEGGAGAGKGGATAASPVNTSQSPRVVRRAPSHPATCATRASLPARLPASPPTQPC